YDLPRVRPEDYSQPSERPPPRKARYAGKQGKAALTRDPTSIAVLANGRGVSDSEPSAPVREENPDPQTDLPATPIRAPITVPMICWYGWTVCPPRCRCRAISGPEGHRLRGLFRS